MPRCHFATFDQSLPVDPEVGRRQISRTAILLCLLGFLAPYCRSQTSTPANEYLVYRVKYDLAAPNLVHIAIDFPPDTAAPQTLIIPRSVPGGYAQRPYDPFVAHVTAHSSSDANLEVRRDDLAPRWLLGKVGEQLARVEYDIDVGRMEREIASAADTSKIRDFYAGFLGYSIFGFLHGFEDRRIALEIAGPQSWPIFTTLAPQLLDTDAAALTNPVKHATAANYYALADSQITMGPRLKIAKLDCADGAVPLFVSMYAEAAADIGLEAAQARDALDKMLAYFGSAPFSHYSVVLEYLKPLPPPHEYNFSMEHLDSGTFFMDVDHALTAASNASEKESTRFNYAHHIAHSWIPKRCYGAGYLPFNWEMTPVIDTIWFNEGFGRYAAIAALADALPKDEAARYRNARLARLRAIVSAAPDFLQRMSLDELSREGSFLYSEDFRVGMNLFSRGALMAAEMDDAIREQTQNQKSLRDALRHLLDWTAQRHRAFRTDELPQIFGEATGVDTTAILNRAMQPLVH
jgi:predicted metalloprotease with PDZ domain